MASAKTANHTATRTQRAATEGGPYSTQIGNTLTTALLLLPAALFVLDGLSPAATRIVLGVWLFAVGGVIGSFLNVVIHRLPAGLSLSRPGSHCPVCRHTIRWYDNVPILAWCWLLGRCRDCGTRISPRYPMVEAITAAVFLTLGWVEALSGGANLPIRPEPVAGGILMLAPSAGQLWGILAYHLLLLSTLLAAAGIEYDGRPVPWRLGVPALAVGCAAPLVWPFLHPVAAWNVLPFALLSGLFDTAAGLIAGVILGLAAWPAVGRRQWPGFLLASACVGTFLGWQAVLAVAIAALLVHAIASLTGRLVLGRAVAVPTMWLAMLTFAWILYWQPILAQTSADIPTIPPAATGGLDSYPNPESRVPSPE